MVIDLPLDQQQKIGRYAGHSSDKFRLKYKDESHLGKNQCREFFQLLESAKRPLLYIGGGLNEKRRVARFAHSIGFSTYLPSTASWKGHPGRIPRHLPGYARRTGTPYANMVIQETDLFVAFGGEMGRPGGPARRRKRELEGGHCLNFDINAEKVQDVQQVFRNPKFSFIGDANTAVDDLLEFAMENKIQLRIGEWQRRAADLKQAFPLNYNRNAEAIQQAEVIDSLSHLITEDTKQNHRGRQPPDARRPATPRRPCPMSLTLSELRHYGDRAPVRRGRPLR